MGKQHQTSADTSNYIQIADTRSVIDLFLEGRTSYPVKRSVTLLNSERIITQHRGHSCYWYTSAFVSKPDREQDQSGDRPRNCRNKLTYPYPNYWGKEAAVLLPGTSLLLLTVPPNSCLQLLVVGTTVLEQESKTLGPLQALQLCPGAGVLTAQRLAKPHGKGTREAAISSSIQRSISWWRTATDSSVQKAGSILMQKENMAQVSKQAMAFQHQQLKGMGEFNQAAARKKKQRTKKSYRFL